MQFTEKINPNITPFLHINQKTERRFFCFELDKEEQKKIAETGELWVALRTFNQPLQPICVTVNKSDVLITQ